MLQVVLSLILGFTVVSCNGSSAEKLIQDVSICEYDESHECDRATREFDPTPTYLMATAKINEVPVDRAIVVEWYYLPDESETPLLIESVAYPKTSPDITTIFAVLGQPDNGWPIGAYEIVLFVSDNLDTTTRQSFVIESNE